MQENIIDIALATYNGAKYIQELLDSLEEQTYQNFIVHVCDDGSTDETITICESHVLFLKNKLIIHEREGGNGASKNFIRAISYCHNSYIALCDQDDFWKSNKLERMLKKLKSEEGDKKSPILVFSDLEIVDAKLSVINSSFFNVSIKSSSCTTPFDFLLSNHVPGCAMMFNQSLKQVFEPIPCDFRMHDWWIILIASFFGKIIFLNESLIQYRQHGNNTVGVVGINKNHFFKNIRQVFLYKNLLNKVEMVRQSFLTFISGKERIDKNQYSEVQNDFLQLLRGELPYTKRIEIFKKCVTGENRLLSLVVWCLI